MTMAKRQADAVMTTMMVPNQPEGAKHLVSI